MVSRISFNLVHDAPLLGETYMRRHPATSLLYLVQTCSRCVTKKRCKGKGVRDFRCFCQMPPSPQVISTIPEVQLPLGGPGCLGRSRSGTSPHSVALGTAGAPSRGQLPLPLEEDQRVANEVSQNLTPSHGPRWHLGLVCENNHAWYISPIFPSRHWHRTKALHLARSEHGLKPA